MTNSTNANGKTIMITGCSSGYGLATARLFHQRGWNVVATMRTPRPELFERSGRLRVVALDVTRAESIAAAVDEVGAIDVLVNNAGIGLFGAFEVTPMATVREVFETNTFGAMAMTQAALPQMCRRRAGRIVNVTSSATLLPLPLVAVYTASKAAIEGFTGSLALELARFGVVAKLVEPGYCSTTAFADNSGDRMNGLLPGEYGAHAQEVFAQLGQLTATTTVADVAEGVWRAVHDETGALRFAAGPDAVAAAQAARDAAAQGQAQAVG